MGFVLPSYLVSNCWWIEAKSWIWTQDWFVMTWNIQDENVCIGLYYFLFIMVSNNLADEQIHISGITNKFLPWQTQCCPIIWQCVFQGGSESWVFCSNIPQHYNVGSGKNSQLKDCRMTVLKDFIQLTSYLYSLIVSRNNTTSIDDKNSSKCNTLQT